MYVLDRNQLETMIKAYNHYYEVHGGSGGIKSREVNGRLVLEGVLKLYWGIHSPIQLKEDDDQRLPCNTFTSKYQRRISNGGEFRVCIHIVSLLLPVTESHSHYKSEHPTRGFRQ